MVIVAFYGVRHCDRFDTIIVDAGAGVLAILRYSTYSDTARSQYSRLPETVNGSDT